MIYFIEAMGAGLVKIGFTERAVVDRLKELQTGCPHRLRVLATVAGSQSDEGDFHRQFAHLRAEGEWFRLDDELRVLTLLAKWVIPRINRIDARLGSIDAGCDELWRAIVQHDRLHSEHESNLLAVAESVVELQARPVAASDPEDLRRHSGGNCRA